MSEWHGVVQVVRTMKGSQGLPLRNHSKELSRRGSHPLRSPGTVAPELLGGPLPPSPRWVPLGFRLPRRGCVWALGVTPGAGPASSFHREPFALTGVGLEFEPRPEIPLRAHWCLHPSHWQSPPPCSSPWVAGGHRGVQGSPWPLPQAE